MSGIGSWISGADRLTLTPVFRFRVMLLGRERIDGGSVAGFDHVG